MKSGKKTVITVIVTALITCLITNTVNDYKFIKNNGKTIKKLTSVLNVIEDYSIYGIEDKDKMTDLASAAFVYSLNDKYAQYVSKNDYKNYLSEISSSYFGIGAKLSADLITNEVTITECDKGMPADLGGVLPGDILLAVDEEECTAQNLSLITNYIKNKGEGADVSLKLRRDGKVIYKTLTVMRIVSDSVSGEMLTDDIGYIKISQFKGNIDKEVRTTVDDFKDNFNTLRDSGMTKIIVDLRDNPGGEFSTVATITDEFLSEGLITYTEDKNGKKSHLYATSGGFDYPVCILVNENTASAAEIFTAALHDNGKATVIGTKTYGKGLVQTSLPLYDGSALLLTTSKYFTPSGVCINEIGIEPDIYLELPEGKTLNDYTTDTDPQIAKAIEVLNKQ